MKTKNLFGILPLFLCVLGFVSCNDDDDVKDPVDTITLNMLNEQNGKTLLGKSDVFINNANNFRMSSSYMADAGNASGVGVKLEPIMNNLSQEVAVTPGHVYQIFDRQTLRDFPSGNRAVQIGAGYYQAYVVSSITNNNSTIGATVKYSLVYPETNGLPEPESVVGSLDYMGATIEIAVPKNAECFVQNHSYESEDTFHVSTIDGKLVITLKKYPSNISGPYGTYDTYIRSGNVYTIVIIKVGM